MKKNSLSGWKEVFRFTFVQTFKNKAFIISFIIMLILAIVSMPLISIILSDNTDSIEEANQPSPIRMVYVNNQTTLPEMDFSKVQEEDNLSQIAFVPLTEDYDTVLNRIETTENTSVIFTITEDQSMYSLDFIKASEGPVKDSNLQALGNAVSAYFDQFKVQTLGITKEQLRSISADVTGTVTLADANGNAIVKEDTSITSSQYWFVYGILFIVMMINIMASTQIATSIVTEKSTKVIEYLLTSVRPLAIMVGKITAMLSAVLIQMITLILVVFVSNQVSGRLLQSNGKNVLAEYLPKDILGNLNPINIGFALIVITLGMIFYAVLAGLAGATISKIEELNEGIKLVTFTNVIGVYIGLAAANVLMGNGDNVFVIFAYLFPLSSPFILPGAILIGKVSILMTAIAILLLVLFVIVLFRFVANVYETLIMHSGNKVKIKELFHISKSVSKGEI